MVLVSRTGDFEKRIRYKIAPLGNLEREQTEDTSKNYEGRLRILLKEEVYLYCQELHLAWSFHRCYYIERSHQQLLRQGIPFYSWRRVYNEASWRMYCLIILTQRGKGQRFHSRSICVQSKSSHDTLPSIFNFPWFSIGTYPQLMSTQLQLLKRKSLFLYQKFKPSICPSWGTIYKDNRLLQGQTLLPHSHGGCPLRQQTRWSALSDYLSGEREIMRMQCGAVAGGIHPTVCATDIGCFSWVRGFLWKALEL